MLIPIKTIKAVFTRDIALPRFSFKKGDHWKVRPDRLEKEGFKLGGGFIYNYEFEVEK